MLKKGFMVAVALGLVLAVVKFAVAADTATPLLKNGGFEEAATEGKIPGWGFLPPETKFSEDKPHAGKYCLLVDKTGSDGIYCGQSVNLAADKCYKLTFFYHAEGNIEAQVGVLVWGPDVPESGCFLKATPDWHSGRIVFYSGKGGDCNVKFGVGAGKETIKLWFDDVALEEMGNADFKSELLLDPGFETGEAGKMPPGWNRAATWDPKHKDNYAYCGVDTSDSHSGKNSLRIDFPQNGFYGLQSDQRIILPDIPYTASVWAKASSEGVGMRVWVWGGAGGGNFVIGKDWQELKINCTLPKATFDNSTTNKHAILCIDSPQQTKETTIWLDDASWETSK